MRVTVQAAVSITATTTTHTTPAKTGLFAGAIVAPNMRFCSLTDSSCLVSEMLEGKIKGRMVIQFEG